MRAVVTGVSGFSGRHLVRRLRRIESAWILGLDAVTPAGALPVDQLTVLDICEPSQVQEALGAARPDYVFHLAGMQRGDPAAMMQTNTVGTLRVLEALRVAAPEARCLVIGSAAEYGHVAHHRLPIVEDEPARPCGAYGASKLAATLLAQEYARAYGLHVAVARPFNLVGAGIPATLVVGALVRRIIAAVRSGGRQHVKVGNLDTVRDFLDVEDAVDAYVRILETDQVGEVFNLCSGEPTTIRAVVETLMGFAPGEVGVEVDPTLVRHGEILASYGHWSKAAAAFGFRPTTPLSETLRRTWNQAWSEEET